MPWQKELGFSWTTDEKAARWFASRFAERHNRDAYLATGTVRKRDVKAYLLSRNEYEIIAFPAMVNDVKIVKVK
ncbi:MAG: hypothetical protein AAAB20_23555 [Rhizobium sp.]|jgi:hypothetical protein|uniref:hypothetical protein n=1 Tax=Rhizobium sp. TaxID=391 RepID=UPI00056A4386